MQMAAPATTMHARIMPSQPPLLTEEYLEAARDKAAGEEMELPEGLSEPAPLPVTAKLINLYVLSTSEIQLGAGQSCEVEDIVDSI